MVRNTRKRARRAPSSKTPRPSEPSASKTPAIFPQYSRLPFEVRAAIWELSLPAPRIINVRAEQGEILIRRHRENEARPQFKHVWAEKAPVPEILQICRDSRTVGLRHYELVFDSNQRPSNEDIPESPSSGLRGRQVVFPFDTKAMIYVDLERDIIVTSHRHLGSYMFLPNPPQDRPEFIDWPVQVREFQITIFREIVPPEVLKRIRTFAVTFALSIREIFPFPIPRGLSSKRRVLVVKNPFLPKEREERGDYIDSLVDMGHSFPGPHMKGKVRSLKNLEELRQVIRDGTLWDWAVDKDHDRSRKS